MCIKISICTNIKIKNDRDITSNLIQKWKKPKRKAAINLPSYNLRWFRFCGD